MRERSPPPTCHVSHVVCHVSRVTAAATAEIMTLNIKKGEKTKKIATKKASLEKEATMDIQAKFQGQLERGLRCFIPNLRMCKEQQNLPTDSALVTLHTLNCTSCTVHVTLNSSYCL